MAAVASPPERAAGSRSALAAQRPRWWLLAGIVLLGAVLRFPTLGEQSFWFDEATTWQIVAHGLGHVLHQVPQTESTPPLYYVLLWCWSRVFGLSEAGLRSLSAVFGTATIVVMWAIGRRVASERTGLVAALLTAANPFLVWYSQEARAYALLLLLSAVSLLTLVRVLSTPSRGRMLAWGVTAALALAAHYYAIVVIVPEALWLAVVLRRRGLLTLRRIALGVLPIVVVGGAQLPLMIHQNDGRAGYISTSGSLPYRVVQLFKQDLIGDGQPVKGLLTAICAAAVVIGLGLLLARARREERTAAVTPLLVGAGGVAVAIIVAKVGTDYFNTRNLLPTWPALMLVVALGLGASGAGRLGAFGTALLVAVGVFCVVNVDINQRYQRLNWRGAAHVLGSASGPRAIVSDIHSSVELDPYLRRLAPFPQGGAPPVREVDLVWLQRTSAWAAITQITPAPLAGFTLEPVIRTSSYVVVRYRAAQPTPEPYAALGRLYPAPSLALLQRP
ncbi:MAG TPA: glycosyltransferase family 39 protein [Solirubrobacteraceae bacterium]|nr:glycosyltransferase family 39 protein [Solirubrobacteraceae bacterium]